MIGVVDDLARGSMRHAMMRHQAQLHRHVQAKHSRLAEQREHAQDDAYDPRAKFHCEECLGRHRRAMKSPGRITDKVHSTFRARPRPGPERQVAS